MKYAFVKEQIDNYTVIALCSALKVSRSGYYNWLHRTPSRREIKNKALVNVIAGVHKETKRKKWTGTYKKEFNVVIDEV